MRNCSAYFDYKPDEYCLERSFEVKMYHVSPRMWIVVFDGVVHRFRGKADAERFYKSIVG